MDEKTSIMIVDDEQIVRESFLHWFEKRGHPAEAAASGFEALEKLEKRCFDIFLVDIKMPKMDGLELLQRIKASERDAEVIVITAYGDMGSAITALQYGASDFILKPVRDEALMLALDRAEQKISIRRELKYYTENLEQQVEMRTRELRKAQEEIVKNERLVTIGETVAGLAHYIKNILNGLRGGMYRVNLAMAKNGTESFREGWQVVERNIEKVSQLVQDLLSYSKARVPQRKRCRPHEIASEVVELLRHKAEENNIRLKNIFDSGIKEAYLDPKGIHDVLLNLVSNAIDACMDDKSRSKSWEVTLYTGPVKRKRGKDGILFQIMDNGCGMGPETRSKLFTRFYSTKEGKGTGLGLLISQKIIHEHGGEISFESEQGVGTTFSVKLGADTRLPSDL
jgi:signal transduction histidine kinase